MSPPGAPLSGVQGGPGSGCFRGGGAGDRVGVQRRSNERAGLVIDSEIPEDLVYTTEHEWIAKISDSAIRVGVTEYAQQQLGDVVFVQLPEIDAECVNGESFGEVESTKSVSDIFAPIDGVVVEINGELDGNPGLVNSDPYGEGWIAVLRAEDPDALDAQLEGGLDAAAYKKLISG